MNLNLRNDSATRVPEALMRAVEHWDRQGRRAQEESRPRYSIAVAREEGAGGTAIARAVGARLGWPVYDHELLEQIAGEMKLHVRLLESIDEKHMNWLEESLASFTQEAAVSKNAFVRHLIATILSLGTHGECVIVGRGSAHILPADRTLRVRLIANLEDRIARVGRERAISAADAEHHIQEVDRMRGQYLKEYFKVDAADPHHYNLVLNTSYFAIPDCVDMIQTGLRHLQTMPLAERLAVV